MNIETIVDNALLASASLGAAYVAHTTRNANRKLHENTRKLDAIADSRLDARIREVVVDVLAEGEGAALRAYFHRLMRSTAPTTDE